MRRLICLLIILLMFVCLLAGIAVAQEAAEPRTQYESFDLSTPEAAVQTFIDLFQRGDYAGAFLIFAPETQDVWYRATTLLALERILLAPSPEETLNDLGELIGFDHTETEHSPTNIPYLFDTTMLYAEQNDLFLIDLRGEVEILETEESTVPAPGRTEDTSDDESPLPAVDVIVSTDQGELRFRMVQVPSVRWRIYQVIVPGGDEDLLPWAVKAEESE